MEFKGKMVIKYFKEEGHRTGDVMFQAENCCPVFKSDKAKVEYEICGNAMRIKDPDGTQHF